MNAPDLTVKFDENGCLKVPARPDDMVGRRAVNEDTLRAYSKHLIAAQNALDLMPTYIVENAPWGNLSEASVIQNGLKASTPEVEKELFELLRQLNAEVVLRVLVMRNLVTAGLMG